MTTKQKTIIVTLTEASQVTGEILHVDGGAHLGQW
jgi:enoyl-[acyl-carrier-protein] reductase (NADH)